MKTFDEEFSELMEKSGSAVGSIAKRVAGYYFCRRIKNKRV